MSRTQFLNCGVVSFGGIKPPYVNAKGIKVTPISVDPSNSDINSAIKTTQKSKNPMEGYNGWAYWLGQDLVVKKYKGEAALNNDPSREINLLDNLYDNGLVFDNSQTGCYAFEVPNGETYLVSTKVAGKTPDPQKSPFTKENLKSLTRVIIQMEKGAYFPNSSKSKSNNRCRFMNYDFNGANMKITPEIAGMYDYEYSQKENIDDKIAEVVLKKPSGPNCNQSDTSGLPSNMRSFEYWTLCDYLNDAENSEELFNDYLEIKGKYHQEMAEFFEEYSVESKYPDACIAIADKEMAHSRLLQKSDDNKIPQDIYKAEARKIQMANFMHVQGPFSAVGKVNIQQILDYSKDNISYFSDCLEQAEKANDEDRIIYYNDCLELMSSWKDVKNVINWQLSTKDQGFQNKLTDDHIKTLDDSLNL